MGHSTPPSQSNQTASSPSHPSQPEQDSHPIPPPTQSPSCGILMETFSIEEESLDIPPFTMPVQQTSHWSYRFLLTPFQIIRQYFQWPDLPLRTQPEQDRNPILPISHRPSHQLQPSESMHQTTSQSPDTPFSVTVQQYTQLRIRTLLTYQRSDVSLPTQSPSSRIPRYRGSGNEFMGTEPAPHVHRMDWLSSCVPTYFLACGPTYTSMWSQRQNLGTSIDIQCFLNPAAMSLFLLANFLFPRTRPTLASVLDRISVLLVVISAYLASMPMFPPYFAIIMFLVVPTVYIVDPRFRGNTRR